MIRNSIVRPLYCSSATYQSQQCPVHQTRQSIRAPLRRVIAVFIFSKMQKRSYLSFTVLVLSGNQDQTQFLGFACTLYCGESKDKYYELKRILRNSRKSNGDKYRDKQTARTTNQSQLGYGLLHLLCLLILRFLITALIRSSLCDISHPLIGGVATLVSDLEEHDFQLRCREHGNLNRSVKNTHETKA